MRTLHPFGELLSQLRARQPGLTQSKLAELTGYDPAVIARMGQGQKDLTGPQARERIIQVIQALDTAGVLNGVEEADALLTAAGLPPLFAGNYAEAALMQTLQQHRRSGLNAIGVIPTPSDTPRHNLPAQPTSFIGRATEIAQIKLFLSDTPSDQRRAFARLVTLTGPGGVGKTRLAVAVATALATDAADGVWWVSFAALHDASLVTRTVNDALRLRQPDLNAPISTLVSHLKGREIVLVLDNCEHVIEACAELAAHLMVHCPNLRLLVTSREALQVPGEITLRVAPLRVPSVMQLDALAQTDSRAMDYEAVQLFVERAQVVHPDFALTVANTSAVVHICERLDGIPLALELAAALLQMLSVEEIAARIDNRFALLKGNYRTVTPRHQALSNAIDWSYDLLTPAEQILLARLSVFVGSWDIGMAERICADSTGLLTVADVVPTLRQLVNKSLVVVEQRDQVQKPVSTRYRLLRTIHEYAAEKLRERNEYDMMQDNHLNDLIDFAQMNDALLTTSAHQLAGERLTEKRDEFRAALAHAEASNNAEGLLRLSAALQAFWRGGYRTEGTEWMHRALALGNTAPARLRLAVMFAWAWTFPNEAADYAKHAAMVEAALAECRAAQDQIGIAQALTLQSDIARAVHGDFATARTHLEGAWRIFETSGDQRAIDIVRHKMGVVLQRLDRAAAEAWMRDSIDRYHASGDSLHLSTTLADLGWFIESGNPHDSRLVDIWQRSVDAAQASGSGGLHAEFLLSLAHTELRFGQRTQAAEHFGQSLELCCAAGGNPDDTGIFWTMSSLCMVDGPRALAIIKDYLYAQQQLADPRGIAAATYFIGTVYQEGEPRDHEQARQYFEQSLAMWRELGVIITRYGSGGVARNLLALGQSQHFLGQQAQAIACYDESLRLCQEHKHNDFLVALHLARGFAHLQNGSLDRADEDFRIPLASAEADRDEAKAIALAGLGEIAQLRGDIARAGKLLGCAAQTAPDIHLGVYSWRADYEALIAAAQTRLSDPVFAAAWAEGQTLVLDKVLYS